MTIPQRRIGRDGPLTGVLSLGSWHTYDRMDFREAVDLVRTAVDSGITLFDVGVYGFPGATPVFTDVLFSAMVRAATSAARTTCFRPSSGWRATRSTTSATSWTTRCSARASNTRISWYWAISGATTPTCTGSCWI